MLHAICYLMHTIFNVMKPTRWTETLDMSAVFGFSPIHDYVHLRIIVSVVRTACL